MMNKEEVKSFFKDIYGDDTEAQILDPVCTAVCNQLEQEVKEGINANDVRLMYLAAALINRRLRLRDYYSADGVESFKAGDVTVTSKPQCLIDLAGKEVNEALIKASPLLKDTGFSFRQVRV